MENIIFHTPVNMIGERYLRRHFTVYIARGGAPNLVVMTNVKANFLLIDESRTPSYIF